MFTVFFCFACLLVAAIVAALLTPIVDRVFLLLDRRFRTEVLKPVLLSNGFDFGPQPRVSGFGNVILAGTITVALIVPITQPQQFQVVGTINNG